MAPYTLVMEPIQHGKKKLLKYILSLTVLTIANIVSAQEKISKNICSELYEYRDNQLYRDFDIEISKYKSLKEQFDIYQKLRQDELSDERLNSMIALKNIDKLLVIPLQTLSNILEAIVPAAWVSGEAAKSTAKSTQKLYSNLKKLNRIEDAITLIQQDVSIAVSKMAFVSKTGYLGQVFIGLSDMTADLLESVERANEWDSTIIHFKDQLKEIDSTIQEINKNLEESKSNYESLNYIKNTIDMICNNEGGTTGSELLSWEAIKTGNFVLSNSSESSGQSLQFNNGYADYCIWGSMSERAKSTGYNLGYGFNKRIVKLDVENSSLRFKPGDFIFSGKKYKITRTQYGFEISDTNQAFKLSNTSHASCVDRK